MACYSHHRHLTNTYSGDICCCNTQSHHLQQPEQPLLQSIYTTTIPQLQSHSYNLHNHHHHQQQHEAPPQYEHQTHYPKQKFVRHRNQQTQSTESTAISSLLRRIDALEFTLRHHSAQYSYSLRDVAARTIQSQFRAFLVRRSRTLRHLEHLAYIKSTLSSLKSSLLTSSSSRFDSQALSHEVMDLLVELESIRGDNPMIRDGKKSISVELVRFMELIEEISVKRTMRNVRISGNGNKSRVLRSGQKMKNADCRGYQADERELMEKIKEKVEKIRRFSVDEENVDLENENRTGSVYRDISARNSRIGGLVKRYEGVQSKAKKNVRFADNGNVYRVFRPSRNGDCNGGDGDSIDDERDLMYKLNRDAEEKTEEDEEGGDGDSVDDGRELMYKLNRDAEEKTEEDEEDHVEREEEDEEEEEDDEGPSWLSNEEANARRNVGSELNYEMRKQDDGSFTFSAPVQEEDDEGPSWLSNEEANARRNVGSELNYEMRKQDDGSFTFSAPVPVKMESRAELMNKKNNVRVAE